MWLNSRKESELELEVVAKDTEIKKISTELLEEKEENLKHREEKKKLQTEANRYKRIMSRLSTIKKNGGLEEDAYLDELSRISKNDAFLWFMYSFREKLITLVGSDATAPNGLLWINKLIMLLISTQHVDSSSRDSGTVTNFLEDDYEEV